MGEIEQYEKREGLRHPFYLPYIGCFLDFVGGDVKSSTKQIHGPLSVDLLCGEKVSGNSDKKPIRCSKQYPFCHLQS